MLLGVVHQMVIAQNIFIPIHHWQNQRVQQHLLHSDSIAHQSIQPLTTFTSQINWDKYKQIQQCKSRRSWLGRKLKSESLVEFKNNDLFFTIDALANVNAGNDDFTAQNTFQNTRGFIVNGEVNQKVYFFTSFYENQGVYPQFLNQYIQQYNIVPGNGRVKNFGANGYDYAMASGMIGIQLKSWLHFQFGNHKNFIGNGYRSLLLSHNSFNYPHAKFIAKSKNNKWVYQTIFASLIDLQRLPATTSSEPQFVRKAGTFHYLSFEPNSKLSLGVFEGNIWKRRNAQGTLPINYNFINPIIFFNSSFNGYNRHHTNNNLGLNLSFRPFKGGKIYGQYLISDIKSNSGGAQYGLQLNKKTVIGHFNVLTEYNQLFGGINNLGNQPSYMHYNQSLGFVPIHASSELVFLFNYNIKDFFVHYQYSRGYNNNKALIRDVVKAELGYLINPITGLKISTSFFARTVHNSAADAFGDANWFTINFSSSLNTTFFDF